jgi:hypothetical protein
VQLLDRIGHHQITVDDSVFGIDIDVAKADKPFGAFGRSSGGGSGATFTVAALGAAVEGTRSLFA